MNMNMYDDPGPSPPPAWSHSGSIIGLLMGHHVPLSKSQLIASNSIVSLHSFPSAFFHQSFIRIYIHTYIQSSFITKGDSDSQTKTHSLLVKLEQHVAEKNMISPSSGHSHPAKDSFSPTDRKYTIPTQDRKSLTSHGP
jgi:hypothetical protein